MTFCVCFGKILTFFLGDNLYKIKRDELTGVKRGRGPFCFYAHNREAA